MAKDKKSVPMIPYYQHNGITIYYGDCLEIMPHLEPVDLVLTDPPYPKLKGGLKVNFTSGVAERYVTNKTVGQVWGKDITPLGDAYKLAKYGMMVFCSFHSVPDIPLIVGDKGIALITWFQRNAMPPINNVPHFQTEFIWVFKKEKGITWRKLKTHYDIPRLQAGCMAKERICKNGQAVHPAQKPIALIKKLLAIDCKDILDPYMGTGTTLVAAKELGREAIGIEIEEKYCEIAVRRLQQEVFQFKERDEQETCTNRQMDIPLLPQM